MSDRASLVSDDRETRMEAALDLLEAAIVAAVPLIGREKLRQILLVQCEVLAEQP
jgi:type II secretory pathway component PulJ